MSHSPKRPPGRPTKPAYLDLSQIAALLAQAAAQQHQALVQANQSRVYLTDQDKFVDLSAHQSVNANPSIDEPGVQP